MRGATVVPVLNASDDAVPDDHVVLVCSGGSHREAEDEQFVALAELAGSEIINGNSVAQRQESVRRKTVGDLDGVDGGCRTFGSSSTRKTRPPRVAPDGSAGGLRPALDHAEAVA